MTNTLKYPEPNNLITLAQILAALPCEPGWSTLLKGLGYSNDGKYDSERQITVADVTLTNDYGDALWCLRVVTDRSAVVRAIMPSVLRAQKYTTDQRVIDCNGEIALWLADGDISKLRAASYSARAALDAARATSYAARAAFDASSDAASYSANYAARAASYVASYAARAAVDAVSDAAIDAAIDAASYAEREIQIQDLKLTFGLTLPH